VLGNRIRHHWIIDWLTANPHGLRLRDFHHDGSDRLTGLLTGLDQGWHPVLAGDMTEELGTLKLIERGVRVITASGDDLTDSTDRRAR
jgi:hypothetical protein